MSEMKKNQSPVGEKGVGPIEKIGDENKPVDKKISDVFGPVFESMNITEGIVIAKMPNSDQVSVYFKGHFYDAASLVAGIHRKFKNKIVQEID